jgi:putative protein-disulfide isomerase
MKLKLILLLITMAFTGCRSQTNKKMKVNNNPLLCDPEKGICEIPTTNPTTKSAYSSNQNKAIKIIYFTDPICSSCWGIEPQLRKLKLEYGNDIQIEYHMGGLLPDWNYNSGGISKPSDVAHHWDEVSKYYDMPIDGDVWLEDPLNSSYPPSIAFKAVQLQDETKAINYLRLIREMVFIEKKNIAKWEHLNYAAQQIGIDTAKFKLDYDGKAKEMFYEDLELAKKLGVRGFPTLLFTNDKNKNEIIYGFQPYQVFEETTIKLFPKAIKFNYEKTSENLFNLFPSLTAKEFSELSGISKNDSEMILQKLVMDKKITKLTTKNGSIWRIKK